MYTKFIDIKRQADHSSIKRLSCDCSEQVIGFLAPNILRTLSQIYKQDVEIWLLHPHLLQHFNSRFSHKDAAEQFPSQTQCLDDIEQSMVGIPRRSSGCLKVSLAKHSECLKRTMNENQKVNCLVSVSPALRHNL